MGEKGREEIWEKRVVERLGEFVEIGVIWRMVWWGFGG